MPDQRRERPADEGARVTRAAMSESSSMVWAVTAQCGWLASPCRAEQRAACVCRRQLADRIRPSAERGTQWLHVDRIFHDGMID